MELNSHDYTVIPHSSRRVDDSVIIQDLDSGDVHELNDVAFFILEACERMLSKKPILKSDEIVQLITENFRLAENAKETVSTDVEHMVDEFLKAGLIAHAK